MSRNRIGDHDSADAPSSTSPAPRRRTSPDGDEGTGYKRQRTALACNSCRYRKSRCDGVRPVCGTCRDMGFECVFRRPAPPVKPPAKDVASLQSRLHTVEQLLQSLVNAQPANSTYNSTVPVAPVASVASLDARRLYALYPDTAGAGANDAQSDRPVPPPEHSMATGWPSSQVDTVDGMGTIIFADESTSGHFGPTSNSSFFSHVARVLASEGSSLAGGRQDSRDIAATLSRPTSPPLPAVRPHTKAINPYLLPARAEILRLVEAFFATTGTFFPYIHKRTILAVVDTFDMVKFTGVRKSWLCLLNAILAIGTSLDSETRRQIKFREAESDTFFQRALVLSPWTISNTANLETLQALAVMTQYLQGTSRSAQTWRLHGLLVQAAFQMGVHTKDVTGKLPALEQEIRTRTWFTCIVLDRVLSMTFGRPPLIHNELIQIDLPQDVELDDLVVDEPIHGRPRLIQNRSGPSSCSLFIATIGLYRIQGDIIREVYNQNIMTSTSLRVDEFFSLILRLDHDLTQWKRSLHPTHALVSLDDFAGLDPQNWPYSRIQTVLTVRYLSVRLLLYRKLLERTLDDIANPTEIPDEDELPVQYTMLQTPVESAVKIISLIRTVATRPEMLPAWWFTAYHIFNAALIVFGVVCAQTVGQKDIGITAPADLTQILRMALDALEIVGKETRIVRRCSKYLKKLVQISSSLVRNHAPTQTNTPGLVRSGPYEAPPSVTDESTQSPFDTEFGQFLIDDDFNFLDLWSDMAQEPAG